MRSIILKTETNFFNSNLMNEQINKSVDLLDAKSFLSLLAMNTNAAIRMYTDHKKWELRELNIDFDVEQYDLENIKLITQKISLLGNLNEDQKMRLLAIVGTCPVQKTVNETIIVNTILL